LTENIDMVKSKPWQSTGYGFVTIIVGYAALFLALFLIILLGVIIGFVTIGGLGGVTIAIGLSALATAAALFSLAVSHISKVIVAVLVGQWIFAKLAPNQTSAVWPMVIGIAGYMPFASHNHYLFFAHWYCRTFSALVPCGLFPCTTAKKSEIING
jgi:hypothetical protein